MMRKRIWLIALIVLVVGALAGWFIARHYLSSGDKKEVSEPDTGLLSPQFPVSGDATATVRIVYPSRDGVTVEERRIKTDSIPVKMTEAIIEEYLRGLPGGLRDTKLLGVYQDRTGVLYVDLSDEFRRSFSGDARFEYYMLKSLFETVVNNSTGIEDVRVLIEGKETETIGGHFFILYPLRETVAEREPVYR